MAMALTYVWPQAVGFAATDLLRKVGHHAHKGLTSKSFYHPSSFTFLVRKKNLEQLSAAYFSASTSSITL